MKLKSHMSLWEAIIKKYGKNDGFPRYVHTHILAAISEMKTLLTFCNSLSLQSIPKLLALIPYNPMIAAAALYISVLYWLLEIH